MPDSTSLSESHLNELDPAVAVPTYDRAGLRCGIVHIGVGGFHRAHLATYAHELAAAGHTDWAIAGCGVMAGDQAMADALGAQDHLYTLITRSGAGTEVQVIASLTDYLAAWQDRPTAIDRIAHDATQIVSLTITEGGYPIDDLTGEYLADSPNAGPDSAFGLIAAGLDARRRRGGHPITIMSCDNILANGAAARTSTLGEAARFGSDLVDWIAESVSFPNSMVDRITPATADSDRAWLETTYGIVDRWPVVTEPFRQWVIEDRFAGARPPLDELDVIVTDDVEPYELMKLRLLNASHSCLAYLSALAGIETVDAAMADPAIAAYVRAFLDREAKPVVPPVVGIDLDVYNDTLIERFSNPAIGDQISRLCLDGSAKFPKFLMPTVRHHLERGDSCRLAALALAGWCEYLLGRTESGDPIEPAADPRLDEAIGFARRSVDDPAAFLEFAAVFDPELGRDLGFVGGFVEALAALRGHGVRSAIESALESSHAR